MKPAAPGYIPALTGVRFLAGLFVFLFHYKPLRSWDNPAAQQLAGVFNEMYTGVGLFFVLSGFLICYIYYPLARIEKDFLKTYFIRRFARIFPIFFLITTLYFVYWSLHGRDSFKFLGIYLMNITLVKGFSKTFMFTGIFQSWSLTVEETFYFLAPFIFIITRRFRTFWLQAPVIVGLGCIVTLFFSLYPFYGFFKDTQFLLMGTFFGRCIEFFIGMQLALMVLRSKKPVASAGSGSKFPLATVAGLVLMALCLFGMSSISNYYGIKYSTDHPLGIFANNIVFPLTVATFFYGLIYERSWVQRFFAWGPVELLGKSSYAFYLIHAGFVAEFIHPLTNQPFFTFIMLQLLAILIFFLIERPVYRWIVRFDKRTAQSQGRFPIIEQPGC
ncbi:MAG: acyltransferase [Chitinophagaceae bacterium]